MDGYDNGCGNENEGEFLWTETSRSPSINNIHTRVPKVYQTWRSRTNFHCLLLQYTNITMSKSFTLDRIG